jgi:hypothetical protein
MTFVTGAYTATYNFQSTGALPIGQTEDSFELEFSLNGDPIRGDNLGDTVQDVINRGGDCFLSMVLIDWDHALTSRIFWTPSATFGKYDIGYIGTLAAGQNPASTTPRSTGVLTLTRVLTVTHSTPVTLTAYYAMLAPGFPVRTLLGPRLRRVPLRMQLLPEKVSPGAPEYRFFVLT